MIRILENSIASTTNQAAFETRFQTNNRILRMGRSLFFALMKLQQVRQVRKMTLSEFGEKPMNTLLSEEAPICQYAKRSKKYIDHQTSLLADAVSQILASQ